MSEACCSARTPELEVGRCPASGSKGEVVDWETVAALSGGPVPSRDEFRLCRDADCEVVYYGRTGGVLTTGDLHIQPGFKAGSDGLVCYCFLHRNADIRNQLQETGRTAIFESIEREVRAGNCACEVRSPSGKCCLGEVRATIRTLEKEMGVTA